MGAPEPTLRWLGPLLVLLPRGLGGTTRALSATPGHPEGVAITMPALLPLRSPTARAEPTLQATQAHHLPKVALPRLGGVMQSKDDLATSPFARAVESHRPSTLLSSSFIPSFSNNLHPQLLCQHPQYLSQRRLRIWLQRSTRLSWRNKRPWFRRPRPSSSRSSLPNSLATSTALSPQLRPTASSWPPRLGPLHLLSHLPSRISRNRQARPWPYRTNLLLRKGKRKGKRMLER